jgi:hypothetical protein
MTLMISKADPKTFIQSNKSAESPLSFLKVPHSDLSQSSHLACVSLLLDIPSLTDYLKSLTRVPFPVTATDYFLENITKMTYFIICLLYAPF